MTAYHSFLANFSISARPATTRPWQTELAPGFNELMSRYSGATFARGLYRLHTSESHEAANDWVGAGWPQLAGRIACFGYDWLGRQFAIDRRTVSSPGILLIEPGTGDALEIPASFVDFHNSILVNQQEAALARSFFDAWSQSYPDLVPLAPDDCAGYRIPLFLGGTDDISNLERTNIEVYWSISVQLRRQAASLAPGTAIEHIQIE